MLIKSAEAQRSGATVALSRTLDEGHQCTVSLAYACRGDVAKSNELPGKESLRAWTIRPLDATLELVIGCLTEERAIILGTPREE